MAKKRRTYLLLDKDNICNICGSMKEEELLKILGLKSAWYLEEWCNKGNLFEGKYIIVDSEGMI